MTKRTLWVVKIGSQLLMDGGPLLLRALLRDLAEVQKASPIRMVWVSSGAIASARRRLNFQWKTLPEKQALSAIGQPLLMDLYNVGLQSIGLIGAQVLLSYSDFKMAQSRKNLRNTIFQLLDWGVIPILNENDAVATDEIQFGDNDQLSSKVACELGAERLIVLTNVLGVYDRNPNHPQAKLIPYLAKVGSQELAMVRGESSSDLGRGGMQSKLLAARNAWRKKIPTTIVQGELPNVLFRLARGDVLGTSIGIPCKKRSLT